MANSLLPPEERNLTPDQVEALDKRRDLGHTFLVSAGQFAVIATILLLWVGQDLSYSPGWAHPMAFYFAIAIAIIVVFGITGLVLRKGTPRLDYPPSPHAIWLTRLSKALGQVPHKALATTVCQCGSSHSRPRQVFQRLLTPELVPDEIFRAAFATLAMNPHNQ